MENKKNKDYLIFVEAPLPHCRILGNGSLRGIFILSTISFYSLPTGLVHPGSLSEEKVYEVVATPPQERLLESAPPLK